MNTLTQKMSHIVKYLTDKQGHFKLFALFLRDNSPHNWDVVVSAQWIDKNEQEALKLISQQLTSQLTKNELISLSHIVTIKTNDENLKQIRQFIPVKDNSTAEIQNSSFFGLDIKQAIFFCLQ